MCTTFSIQKIKHFWLNFMLNHGSNVLGIISVYHIMRPCIPFSVQYILRYIFSFSHEVINNLDSATYTKRNSKLEVKINKDDIL